MASFESSKKECERLRVQIRESSEGGRESLVSRSIESVLFVSGSSEFP